MKASTPEPAPVHGGFEITPALKLWIEQTVKDPQARQLALALVNERDLFGRQKYGQSLMSDDGRDSFEDLIQELGDALQYAFKCRVNGLKIKARVLPLLNVLLELVNTESDSFQWRIYTQTTGTDDPPVFH